MNFRDDFDTLDTTVWQIRNTLPNKATVQAVNGKLRLSVSGLLRSEGSQDIGITYKNPLNLINSQIDIPLELLRPSSYAFSMFGIGITNVPLALARDVSPYQRGVWMGILGTGYQDALVDAWIIDVNKWSYRGTRNLEVHPFPVRIRIGKNGVYFYFIKNGEEWFMHSVRSPIDFSQCYLSIFFVPSPIADGASLEVQTDYIQVSPYNVAEGTSFMSFGENVTPPDFPPEVLYTLLGNMIPILVGNSLLGLAERIKK